MTSTSMFTEDSASAERVIVVGLNRSRILRIMKNVVDAGTRRLNVEYIVCVATMSSYEGKDGKDVRYMSSFTLQDGSPMSTFFDNEEFRLSLRTVIMVGYEWKETDDELVKKYFDASMLLISVKCVRPNECFSTLNEELYYFMNLTDEEKALDQTTGPLKMAHFIIDTITCTAKSLTLTDSKRNRNAQNEVQNSEQDDEKEKNFSLMQQEEEQQKKMLRLIDQNSTTYACRMCRTVLFGTNHLVEHKQNQHSFHRKKHNKNSCQSLFCNESVIEWLSQEGQDNEGKLTCPKCSVKVGHWNWSGAQCSCGTWVVPAVQIPLSRVDIIVSASERTKASPTIVVATINS
mmetsp:Transcript_1009/g.1167  ORF Transcript_1009/g.1167 Transcript_1009/m.1167 type:complete len:346 (+) Transcript_1009:1-1038(+)